MSAVELALSHTFAAQRCPSSKVILDSVVECLYQHGMATELIGDNNPLVGMWVPSLLFRHPTQVTLTFLRRISTKVGTLSSRLGSAHLFVMGSRTIARWPYHFQRQD